ncbi:MFS transporter [Enterobacterales bacterium AW_CKDN230030176-1A_HGKHYDSX7]
MRVLLGIALGDFGAWLLLLPCAWFRQTVPRALSIVFSGIAIGAVVSLPLGSDLGERFGWRSAFFAAAGVSVLTLVVQYFTLPRMAPRRGHAGCLGA